jgi:adenylate cyclase
VAEFLDGEQRLAAVAAPHAHGLVTILFTDMEGSTTFTQRLGDAAAQEVLRAHNDIVRRAVQEHGGSIVKTAGDGFMVSFSSASRAVECAIGIQSALAQHNQERPDLPIRVRIGLNAGEPIAEDEDLFGTAVIVASRVAERAQAGQILVSDVVRQLAAGKGFTFEERGRVTLKGLSERFRLYEVVQ